MSVDDRKDRENERDRESERESGRERRKRWCIVFKSSCQQQPQQQLIMKMFLANKLNYRLSVWFHWLMIFMEWKISHVILAHVSTVCDASDSNRYLMFLLPCMIVVVCSPVIWFRYNEMKAKQFHSFEFAYRQKALSTTESDTCRLHI